jgi:hypothetical protein
LRASRRSTTKSPKGGSSHDTFIFYPQVLPPEFPHASGTLAAPLIAMLVAGTAASETVASAVASSFFVFDI